MKFMLITLSTFVFVSVLLSAVFIDSWQFWALLGLWLIKEHIIE